MVFHFGLLLTERLFRRRIRGHTKRKKMEQGLSHSLEETQVGKCEISALLKALRAVLQNKSFPDSARELNEGYSEERKHRALNKNYWKSNGCRPSEQKKAPSFFVPAATNLSKERD